MESMLNNMGSCGAHNEVNSLYGAWLGLPNLSGIGRLGKWLQRRGRYCKCGMLQYGEGHRFALRRLAVSESIPLCFCLLCTYFVRTALELRSCAGGNMSHIRHNRLSLYKNRASATSVEHAYLPGEAVQLGSAQAQWHPRARVCSTTATIVLSCVRSFCQTTGNSCTSTPCLPHPT